MQLLRDTDGRQVRKEGLQQKKVEYGIAFTPLTTIPNQITIKGPDFVRHLPWGEVAGSVISLPSSSLNKTSNISIDVVLTDYELGIPQSCEWKGSAPGVFTAFCGEPAEPACNDEDCCRERCGHRPECLAATVGRDGCFQARNNRQDLQAMRNGHLSHVRERQWLNRSVRGKICRLAGTSNCQEALASADHVLSFSGMPDWLDDRVELKLALALADGEQQFYSDSEGLQLKLGPPDILDVLVNLTGLAHNGSTVYLNATASVQEQDLVVTLQQYPPYAFVNLSLYVAVLLPDPDYAAVWAGSAAEVMNNSEVRYHSEVRFERCDRSLLLKHRYPVCQGGEGLSTAWRTPVVKVTLGPWDPAETEAAFNIVHVNSTPATSATKAASARRTMKLRLEGVESVGAWALPPREGPPGSPAECRFLASPEDLLPPNSSENASVPQESSAFEGLDAEGARALWPMQVAAAEGAACELIHRQCRVVRWHALGGSTSVANMVFDAVQLKFLIGTQNLDWESARFKTQVRTLFALHSTTLWRAVRCMFHANASLPSLAETCRGLRDPFQQLPFDPFQQGEFISCKVPGWTFPRQSQLARLYFSFGLFGGWPLAATKLLGLLRPEPNELDARLVQDSCRILFGEFRADERSKRQELEESLLEAAVGTSNLQALNLTLRFCVPSGLTEIQARTLWGLSARGMLGMVGMVWAQAPQHLSALLQAAAEDRCETCLDTWRSELPDPAACTAPAELRRSLSLDFQAEAGQSRSETDDLLAKEAIEATDLFLRKLLATPCVLPFLTYLKLRKVHTPELLRSVTTLVASVGSSLTTLVLDQVDLSDHGDEFAEAFHGLQKLRSFGWPSLAFERRNAGVSRGQVAQLLSAAAQLEDLSLSLESGDVTLLDELVNKSTALGRPCLLRRVTLTLHKDGAKEDAEDAEVVMALVKRLRDCPALTYVNLCPHKSSSGGYVAGLSNASLATVGQMIREPAWPNLTSFEVKSAAARQCTALPALRNASGAEPWRP